MSLVGPCRRLILAGVGLATAMAGGGPANGARPHTVILMHVGDKLARADLLRPSVHRYLRYMISVDGHRTPIDIWTRTLTLEMGADGRSVLHLHQLWDEAVKPPLTLYQDSWFDPDTMAPGDHIRKRVKDGAPTVSGLHFARDKITGITDLPDNSVKAFALTASEAPYNWEADMEYLAALPLRGGVSFSIPFFDPGTPDVPTARYIYRVAGSDRVATESGPVECWRVEITFPGEGVARFWFAKANHVLIREQTTLNDGQTLVKLLIPAEAPASGPAY